MTTAGSCQLQSRDPRSADRRGEDTQQTAATATCPGQAPSAGEEEEPQARQASAIDSWHCLCFAGVTMHVGCAEQLPIVTS